MDKLKYVKLENPDGTYSNSIPLAVDSDYVDINGNTLTEELGKKANDSDISNLQNEINGLASGSPLVASSISEMTDTDHIYVNTTDGNWYYYNGNSWSIGGIYQAIGVDENDSVIVEINDRLDLINNDLIQLNKNYEMGSITASGEEQEKTDGTRWRTPLIDKFSSANIEYIDVPEKYFIWIFYYINGNFSSRKGPYTNQQIVPIKPSTGADIRVVVAKGRGYAGVLTLNEIKRKIKIVIKNDLKDKVETLENNTSDLEDRVEQLEDHISEYETVPTYWKDYLNEKYETLNNLDATVGDSGDSFIFITDTHIDDNNMKSPLLIKSLLKNTSTNKVICGGDILTSYATQQEAINKLATWRNAFDVDNMMTLLGNHDLNHEGNSENTEAYLTKKMFFGITLKKYENIINNLKNYSYNEGCYYDNESQKIRYIYLWSGSSAAAVIGDGQINYMKARINELATGWSAIVFTHMFFSPSTTSTVEPNGNGRKIIAGLDEIYDTCDATIIGVIAGHIHRDYNMTSDKGYPIITTTCDASGTHASTYDINYPTRTAGTTTEQAFDVFHIDKDNRKIYVTRIGAGIDREFNY